MTPLRRFLNDWGLPQALFQLVLALPVFAAVEYVSGDRVLPPGSSPSFSRWQVASATDGQTVKEATKT